MTVDSNTKFREEVVEISKRLYERKLVAGSSGNISTRKPSSEEVFITPSGLCKGYLKKSDILRINLQGEIIQGKHKPTSETPLHTMIYRLRDDVNGVVHTHSPMATALSCMKTTVDSAIHPEVIVMLGEIKLVEYVTPTTADLANTIKKYVSNYDCFLLENHGALTIGSNLQQAYERAELLEEFALITIITRILGGASRLPQEEVRKLQNLPSILYRKALFEKKTE